MIDGLSGGELALVLVAVLAVVTGWRLYLRLRPGAGRRNDPAAAPPETAVPVDSALVELLYAARGWKELRPLLADDFALVGPDGARAGLEAFRRAVTGDDRRAAVELILADLAQPTVLFVRARTEDERAWTRVVVAPNGTRVRELGPSTVVS